jgi:hypothetical protein
MKTASALSRPLNRFFPCSTAFYFVVKILRAICSPLRRRPLRPAKKAACEQMALELGNRKIEF